MTIELKRLSLDNFSGYESITDGGEHRGCFCSFWHQKWNSMADWERCQKETPEVNRSIVCEKVRSGFHVGVLAYGGPDLVEWVSVGTLRRSP